MAEAPRAGSTPPPAKLRAAQGASVLEVIGRLGGAAPKVLLRDSPSEHGGTPMLDAASPEARQVPAGRGNYEFHGEIARGGMGVILKGHDRDLGRDVAVKVLKKELAQKAEIVARFVEEAQIGGQLQHPGIVPIFELGLLADERPYFTMKLVKGRTLAALLTERATPEADRHRFLGVFEQVCQTMAYAHSKGVIHRDLKPANIMVGAFGEVQVLDWGLAKVLAQGGVADEKRERQLATHMTIIATVRHKPGSGGSSGSDSLAGSVMGTPAYMPPEQARGEIDRLDERSDVFSLGAILCEILTGRPPYVGESDEVMTNAANAALKEATARLEGCSADAELIEFAKRCLAPAPAARPRHAGLLAKELATWRGSVDDRARAAQIAAAEARVKAEDERRSRRLTLALAGTIVAALVLGGGGWVAWNAKQQAWQQQTQLWQSQTEQRVNGSLADAALYRGKQDWTSAIASMEQALAVLDAGQHTDELDRRVKEMVAIVATEAAAAGRQEELAQQNRELLAHVKKLRAPELGEPARAEAIDESYTDAFSAYGLPLDDWSVDLAAKSLIERGIAEPAAAALDDWADARRRSRFDEDAEHLVQIALKADPDVVRSRLRRAIVIGDRSLLREFSRDEDLAKLPANSLNLLATAFKKADAAADAIRVLKVAQFHHPEDYVVNFNLGVLYRDSSPPRFDDAARCFQAALAGQADDPQLQMLLGFLLVVQLGDPKQGFALLELAVRSDPDDVSVRSRYARALAIHEEFDRAIAEYAEVARRTPTVATAHTDLADTYASIGDNAAAIPIYREALRLDPRDEEAHASLGYALLDSGDLAGAEQEYDHAVKAGGTRLTTKSLEADLCAARGDREGARRSIQTGIENTSQNNVMALFTLGNGLVAFRDPTLRDAAAAQRTARRLLEISPRSGGAWSLLGSAFYRGGDWRGCVEAMERAIQLRGGGNATTWFFLAMAHERLGSRVKALDFRRQAVEWMEARRNRHLEIVNLRAEADALLGIEAGERAMNDAPKRPSLIDVIGRLSGAAPKILLRDSPSEHGGSPILDASSPEFRQFRQLPSDRGNHELLGEIARGGMGVILKGHDRDLGRDVAVKVLKQELAKRPEIVARFVEEAQIGGQLQHPGIVPVYELGLLADERPYFTMKLVKGRTLAALLTERATPDADRHRFLVVFEQVCQTLAYSHSKGVIHRDLKPANIMVGAFGEVQVLDWGLAKVLAQGGVADERRERERTTHATIISTVRHQPGSAGSSGSDSLAGSVMGTPAYMPPEQARGEVDHLDERSDVFALGAILCEILTGQPPYGGAADEVVEQAANAQIDPALKRLSECGADAELVALAKRCLAPAPAARPRHAGVVAKEVATWRAAIDERTRAAQIAVAEARVKADEERRARRLTVALAGAVIVILTLGAGGYGYLTWQRQLRQEQTAARVDGALDEARRARGEKEWEAATAAVQQALALLDAGQPTEELRKRVKDQAAVIASEAAAATRQAELARQNQELLAHLAQLRAPGIGPNDLAPIDEAYVDAFSAYGLELDELAVDEAVRAIGERGIAVEVATALDDWGSIRSALGKRDDADHVMRIAEQLDADPTRRRLRAALRSGDYGLLKEFSKDEGLARLPALSLCLLADAFLRAKDERRAVAILRLSRVAHPGDFTTCVVLAEQLSEGSGAEIEEAAQCCFAALALRPELARVHVNVARFLISPLGDPARGIALFERAVTLDPHDEWIRRRFGWALIDLGDPRRAVEQFREGVRIKPEDDDAHASLAAGLLEVGELEAALAQVAEALRLEPRNEDALEGKVGILLAMGDVAGAVKASDDTQQIRPKLIFARWNVALTLAASGERAAAKRAIEEAIGRSNTKEAMSMTIAADALLRMPDPALRDPARAASLARAAIEIAPKLPWGWELLGAALYRAGDWNGCIDAIERALPFVLEASAFDRFHLAMAYQQIGRHAKALEHWQEGVAWMERQQSRNVDLVRLRDEASRILRIEEGGK